MYLWSFTLPYLFTKLNEYIPTASKWQNIAGSKNSLIGILLDFFKYALVSRIPVGFLNLLLLSQNSDRKYFNFAAFYLLQFFVLLIGVADDSGFLQISQSEFRS